jgi:hypothetical protein
MTPLLSSAPAVVSAVFAVVATANNKHRRISSRMLLFIIIIDTCKVGDIVTDWRLVLLSCKGY